ncbi:MAG TPA: hypothetical protein VMZ74_00330 [Ramlibacter sp.]|nr:hypothetical protein [Ramlibacter sp.]
MGREYQEIDSWSDRASCGFDIVTGEFVVVTADAADLPAYRALSALLGRMRNTFGIDAAFIAQWADGEPVARYATGESDALQASYGMSLLASGDTPYDAVPVVTTDGFEYGTLCCRGADEKTLRSVARLIADWFEEAELSLSGLLPMTGESVMSGLPLSFY